jgi:peptide/nickel transport system ATP-binding protein
MPSVLLDVRNLGTHFRTQGGVVQAVRDVGFTVGDQDTVCIVGESGCGKSMTALSIMRLIPSPPGRIVSGTVRFQGVDLLSLPAADMHKIRGGSISMIFQEPMTSLNPLFTVGEQIAESIRIHSGRSRADARDAAIEMLKAVRIPSPDRRYRDYPHQLSGGMRQRVMIAIAFCCSPRLLIADEPTTALDVTIQAQILALMNEMKERQGTSVILITHDLGVVAENAQKVVVMYAGEVVEIADVDALFARPLHPYSRALLASIPRRARGRARQVLATIPGKVPDLIDLPACCRFRDRCSQFGSGDCPGGDAIPLREAEADHWVRCNLVCARARAHPSSPRVD